MSKKKNNELSYFHVRVYFIKNYTTPRTSTNRIAYLASMSINARVLNNILCNLKWINTFLT